MNNGASTVSQRRVMEVRLLHAPQNDDNMRSKEFIEKLLEEGGEECYVRWGGVPMSVRLDMNGPFVHYKDGRPTFTMKGSKLVFEFKNMRDFITKDLHDWWVSEKRDRTLRENRQMLIDKLNTMMVFNVSHPKHYIESLNEYLDEWIKEMEEKQAQQ